MHQQAKSPLMRPQVLVNCAMSPDGKIATKERRQVRISSEEDMLRVKELRATCDAILVGVGTVLADDPHLTIKGNDRERNPLRVVLDPRGRTPVDAKVLDARARTLIVTLRSTENVWPGVDVFRSGEDFIDLLALMDELERLGVRTLMVEGGARPFGVSSRRVSSTATWYMWAPGFSVGGRRQAQWMERVSWRGSPIGCA